MPVLLAVVAALALAGVTHLRLRGMGQFRIVAESPSFRRLLVAQSVSNLGDMAFAIAVATWATQTYEDPRVFASLVLAQAVPAVAVGLLGGVLLDRVPRKWVLVGADLTRGMAILALATGAPTLPRLYVVSGLLGLFGALYQPALRACLPNVVAPDRLVAANALVSGTYYLAIMAGPVLGGLLVAGAGPRLAFTANALSFAVSAAVVARARLPVLTRQVARVHPVRETLAGLRYAGSTALIRSVFIVTGVVMVAAAMRSPLEPRFVLGVLGAPATALGLVGGAWGLGMLLGAVLTPAAVQRWPRERLLWTSVALVGTCGLLAARADSLQVLLILWVASGVGNAMGTVSYESLLQERTPDAMRGRVLAASEAVLDGAYVAGVPLGGWLGAVTGVRSGYAVSGLVFLLAAVASRALLRPQVIDRADEVDQTSTPSLERV